MPPTGRDRLRELLDAVLDDENARLHDMAGDAYASPWHFSRRFARDTGESPVSLRRRVMLERAAWQIKTGSTVTDAAFAAGYDSVEGFSRAFSRAFGHPPSATGAGSRHWLDSPNGIHFHPPTSLWVEQPARRQQTMDLTSHLVHHDVDDTTHLLTLAADLDEADYRKVRTPGVTVLPWDGPEESLAAVLHVLVWSKQVWLASIEGEDFPERGPDDVESLLKVWAEVSPRWIRVVEDIETRGGWGDTLIDALCEPPESFVMGSVIAHVLTFSAHRRQVARQLMRSAGMTVDHGDPIEWLRSKL